MTRAARGAAPAAHAEIAPRPSIPPVAQVAAERTALAGGMTRDARGAALAAQAEIAPRPSAPPVAQVAAERTALAGGMTHDARGADPAARPEIAPRPSTPPVAPVAAVLAGGKGARRARMYTGGLTTLGCYAAVARDASPAARAPRVAERDG
jgi:hypothetical protein